MNDEAQIEEYIFSFTHLNFGKKEEQPATLKKTNRVLIKKNVYNDLVSVYHRSLDISFVVSVAYERYRLKKYSSFREYHLVYLQ